MVEVDRGEEYIYIPRDSKIQDFLGDTMCTSFFGRFPKN